MRACKTGLARWPKKARRGRARRERAEPRLDGSKEPRKEREDHGERQTSRGLILWVRAVVDGLLWTKGQGRPPRATGCTHQAKRNRGGRRRRGAKQTRGVDGSWLGRGQRVVGRRRLQTAMTLFLPARLA